MVHSRHNCREAVKDIMKRIDILIVCAPQSTKTKSYNVYLILRFLKRIKHTTEPGINLIRSTIQICIVLSSLFVEQLLFHMNNPFQQLFFIFLIVAFTMYLDIFSIFSPRYFAGDTKVKIHVTEPF